MTTQDPFCTVVNCISLKASPEKHSSHISQAVSSLINEHNDVLVISSSGESVAASRSLLCLSSPVLRDLLAPLPCCANPAILLPDFSTQAIKHLISIISNGFSTSHLGHGLFKDINQVMDMSRLLSIADLTHLSYEKCSVDFENEGTSDVRSNSILLRSPAFGLISFAYDQIDIKVEPVDVSHQVPVIESCKSLQTGEDIFYSGKIVKSLKTANIEEENLSVSRSSKEKLERPKNVQTPPAKLDGKEPESKIVRQSTSSIDTKRLTENLLSAERSRSIGSHISVKKEKQRSPVRFPGSEKALVKKSANENTLEKKSHGVKLSRNSNTSSGNNVNNSRWSCEECDFIFLTRDLLREHRRNAQCKIGTKKPHSKKSVSECVDFNENIKTPETLSSSVNKQSHKKYEGSRGKVTKSNDTKVQTLEHTKKAGKLHVETTPQELNSKRRKSLIIGSEANDQKEISSTANIKGHQKCEGSRAEVTKRTTSVETLKPTKATNGGEVTKSSTTVEILKPSRGKASLDLKLKSKKSSNGLRYDHQKGKSKSRISSKGERFKSGSRVTSGDGGRSEDGGKCYHKRSREGSEKRSPRQRSSTTPGGRRRPRTRTLSRSRGSSRYRSRSKLEERSRERSRFSSREESKIGHSKDLGKKSSKIKEEETQTVDRNISLEALERMRNHVRSKISAVEVEEGEIIEFED